MKSLLFIPLIFMFGCSEFITYTIVSAGSLTGQIAHDQYNEHFNDTPIVRVEYHYDRPKKKTTGKEKKDGFRNQASK